MYQLGGGGPKFWKCLGSKESRLGKSSGINALTCHLCKKIEKECIKDIMMCLLGHITFFMKKKKIITSHEDDIL